MYRIPRIDCNVACPASLEEAFARTVRETVACNNWPADFPYAPQVGFRIFHTGADLLLRLDVAERCTAARTLDDNGPVWTDSCAEFFFRPEGSDSYYNFECNCIGTLLVGHRRDRTQAEHAPAEVLRTVRRRATYPHAPLPETEGDNRWTLTLAIPAAALFRDRLARWDGVRGAMNLYKCGDDLSCPHYLSWRPVGTPAPDFHRPEFFEPVFFEPKKQ